MIKALQAILLGVLAMLPVMGYSDWAVNKEVRVLKVQTNGTYLVLSDFADASDYGCEKSAFFMMNTEENYSERTSFLLAAFMAGERVSISYYGCEGQHLKLGSVSFEK